MKDKKGKKAQSPKKNKQKGKEASSCLSFGKLDLIYKIEFTEKDLEKPEEEVQQDEKGEKYYNIENINSIKDLKFIQDKKNILDKIALKGNNATLEQILTGNKMSKKKTKMEFIPYGIPKFEGEDEFFDKVYNYLNEKNHLDVNEKPLIEDGPYSLTFDLNFKDKSHSFSIGTGGDNKEEENKNEENKEEEKKEENNEEKTEPKKEEEKTEPKKEEKKEEPKKKRKKKTRKIQTISKRKRIQ